MQQPATVRKPEGGFVFISVRQLCRAWVTYQQRQIHIVDLRVWFAAHELVARRCQIRPGQRVHYREEELARLVGGTHSMPVSLRRLATAGLLHWEDAKLTFPDERAETGDSEALATMLEQVANRHRLIPVPRRLIRYLAGDCHKVMVATILGHLFRCLYYRNAYCRPAGHCKATWIAEVFGVSVRQVKQTRKMLEGIGLFQRSVTPQWVMNRYGQTMTFNLQWEGPLSDPKPRDMKPAEEQLAVVSAVISEANAYVTAQPMPQPRAESRCPVSHPLPAEPIADPISPVEIAPPPCPQPTKITPPACLKNAHIAPPNSYAELSTRRKDQKPASGSTPGPLITLFLAVRTALREGRLSPIEENPIVVRSIVASSQSVPSELPSPSASGTLVKKVEKGSAQASLPAPTLRHILAQDLRDTARLLRLYDQAVTAGLAGSAEADRLAFVALAQHVLSYRPDNAGGLFTQLLRKRHFNYATQDDEDVALQRLKRHFHSGPPSALSPLLETVLMRAG